MIRIVQKNYERDKSKLSSRHISAVTASQEFFQLITKWHKNWINLILLYCILKSIPLLYLTYMAIAWSYKWINFRYITNLVGIQHHETFLRLCTWHVTPLECFNNFIFYLSSWCLHLTLKRIDWQGNRISSSCVISFLVLFFIIFIIEFHHHLSDIFTFNTFL